MAFSGRRTGRPSGLTLSRGVFLLLVFCAAARAQEVWSSKPYQEWSKADAEKVLRDSPWVKRQSIKVRPAATLGRVAGAPNPIIDGAPAPIQTEGNTAALGRAQAPVDYTYTLRLRSALPIRQALARLAQLETNTARMSEKDRAAHEARLNGLLQCPACADNYVLTLSAASKESPGSDPVYTSFAGGRFEALRRYVFLANDRGGRRELAHFVPPRAPGDEAIFFFPRLDERGAPLFTPESKELILNLTNNEVDAVTNFRLDVARLLVGGKVEF